MSNSYAIPIAIIVAGALIAGAFFLVNRSPQASVQQTPLSAIEPVGLIPPVTEDDHIRGNPNAEIIIVEYSDTECPFCKQFHTTMKRIMDEYGRDGKVAWVYRHFPIEQLHAKAQREAEATECAAELGGNDAFWAYVDRIFEVTPSNDGLDLALLPEIAEEVGLDRSAFQNCLSSGRHAPIVEAQFDQAIAAGGQGTPFNVFISGGEQVPVEGSQPYTSMKAAIDSILDNPTGNASYQAVPSITP